jgi:two-component system, LytTR family, sensor kinase
MTTVTTPRPRSIHSQIRPIVLCCFAVCTVVFLTNSAQLYIFQHFAGFDLKSLAEARQLPPGVTKAADGPAIVQYMATVWYSRAFLSPILIYIAVRYRIQPETKVRGIVLQLLCGLLLGLIVTLLQACLINLLVSLGPAHYEAAKRLALEHAAAGTIAYWIEIGLLQGRNYIAYNILGYWILTLLIQAWYYYHDGREKQLQTSMLEAQLASTRLTMLRLQLNPHFLFNTLHAIGTLIEDDPTIAQDMLLRLSKLLRVFLEENSPHEIPLHRELQFMEWQLGIERVRFGSRLRTEIVIDSQAMECVVPHLILQPLVENAIQHGIAKHAGRDLIEIRGGFVDGQLSLQVTNETGVLPTATEPALRYGIGLSNTESRLEALYQNEFELSIESLQPRGVITRVLLPIRRQDV